MIAETLAGISLFKAAVDGIKGTIGTAKDVGEIAGFLDKLFEGESQVQQQRNKRSGVGGLGDQFGVTNVAREVIDAKLAKEQMQEIAAMVDMRFGHGTWASIVAERAKRIQEAKQAEIERRKQEAIKYAQMQETIVHGIVALLAAMAIALGIASMIYFASGS